MRVLGRQRCVWWPQACGTCQGERGLRKQWWGQRRKGALSFEGRKATSRICWCCFWEVMHVVVVFMSLPRAQAVAAS
eukprot:10978923-Alexandrium_andersonii.AAC.1